MHRAASFRRLGEAPGCCCLFIISLPPAPRSGRLLLPCSPLNYSVLCITSSDQTTPAHKCDSATVPQCARHTDFPTQKPPIFCAFLLRLPSPIFSSARRPVSRVVRVANTALNGFPSFSSLLSPLFSLPRVPASCDLPAHQPQPPISTPQRNTPTAQRQIEFPRGSAHCVFLARLRLSTVTPRVHSLLTTPNHPVQGYSTPSGAPSPLLLQLRSAAPPTPTGPPPPIHLPIHPPILRLRPPAPPGPPPRWPSPPTPPTPSAA